MPNNSAPPPHTFVGVACILFGLVPLAIALDLVPGAADRLHAPRWVAAMAGVVFIIAGCMALLQAKRRLVDALAFVLLFLFGVIGAWVALFSPGGGITGGIPFLSSDVNGTVGRVVFGLGAVLSFAMSLYALRMALRGESKPGSQAS